MAGLPTRTVTFLFTDIEGSTAPHRVGPVAYQAAHKNSHHRGHSCGSIIVPKS